MKELIKGTNPIDALIELNGTKTDGESIKMSLACYNPCPYPLNPTQPSSLTCAECQ